MKKLLREPLLHFALLGGLIFAVNAWRRSECPTRVERIEVTAAVVGRLLAGYERRFDRSPDEEDLRGLVTAHIREEVLCHEALALGLDRNDTIVRRRLAQKMEFLTDEMASTAEPDSGALRTFFQENAARNTKPALMSFRHVYFSAEKRGAKIDAAAREALAALVGGASDETMGDGFLRGFEFAQREPSEVGLPASGIPSRWAPILPLYASGSIAMFLIMQRTAAIW